MRFFTATLALLALAALPCRADGVSFARVWPQWHESEWFQSYHEYRTSHELTGGWIVVRSQPKERSGLYFLTRVENKAGALQAASFTIRVIRPDSTDTKVYTFAADIPAGSHLFEIGLTGTDWVWPRTMPVAWEVELHAADGSLLAQKASFLWEKPEGPEGR